MTVEQKEKICFRLYLACFVHPDDAPHPQTYAWARSRDSVAMTDRQSVTVKLHARTIGSVVHDWARVDVAVSAREFHILGPIDVVEAALKALPDDLKVQR